MSTNNSLEAKLSFGDLYQESSCTNASPTWGTECNKYYALTDCELFSIRKDAVFYTPEGAVYGIEVKMCPPKNQKDFYEWFYRHSRTHNGFVEITVTESGTTNQTNKYFQFLNGEVILIHNTYSKEKGHLMTASILAREIVIPNTNSVVYKIPIERNALSINAITMPKIVWMVHDNVVQQLQEDAKICVLKNPSEVLDFDMNLGYSFEEFANQKVRLPQFLTFTLRTQPNNFIRQQLYEKHLNCQPTAISFILDPPTDNIDGRQQIKKPSFAYVFEGYILEIHENFSVSSEQNIMPITIKMSVNTHHIISEGNVQTIHNS